MEQSRVVYLGYPSRSFQWIVTISSNLIDPLRLLMVKPYLQAADKNMVLRANFRTSMLTSLDVLVTFDSSLLAATGCEPGVRYCGVSLTGECRFSMASTDEILQVQLHVLWRDERSSSGRTWVPRSSPR
jgi:hypothetical protein